jgi:hypothetical protein
LSQDISGLEFKGVFASFSAAGSGVVRVGRDVADEGLMPKSSIPDRTA